MDVFKIGKYANAIIILLAVSVVVITVGSLLTQFNFDNYTPKNYIGVVIDGKDKRFKRLYVDDYPTVNAESTKSVVVDYVNQIMNYNSTNFRDVIEESRANFDKRYYKSYRNSMYDKIVGDINNGYHITRSIVSEKPLLLGKAFDGKNMLYRYKLKTSTVYKSEFKPLVTSHDIIIVIKVENPRDNIKGLSIASITVL